MMIRGIAFSFLLTGCAHEIYFGGHPEYAEPARKETIADDIALAVYMFRGIPGLSASTTVRSSPH